MTWRDEIEARALAWNEERAEQEARAELERADVIGRETRKARNALEERQTREFLAALEKPMTDEEAARAAAMFSVPPKAEVGTHVEFKPSRSLIPADKTLVGPGLGSLWPRPLNMRQHLAKLRPDTLFRAEYPGTFVDDDKEST